jgi:cell wall-associated NlpC family hydrolase
VSSAYSCIGYPYIYGASSPSDGGFDCSGLVYYCFIGYRAGTAGTIGRAIKAAGVWKDSLDDLVSGDVVFTRSNYDHIGIYIGGGQMIHAPSPGRTVCVSSVYAFYGGGPFRT